MGLLMLAGLAYTLGYMGHYAKNQTTAIIGDATIQPTGTLKNDKEIIKENFELICKRGNAKLDKNNNPINKGCKQCCAYLQYQGFQQSAVNYFEKIYLKKYNKKYKDRIKEIKDKHWWLEQQFHNEYDKCQTKIIRHWDYGDTHTKCEKIMNNWFWSHMVTHYNIVKDGISHVEVWTIKAPPSILRQIDTIYNEVCEIELYKE